MPPAFSGRRTASFRVIERMQRIQSTSVRDAGANDQDHWLRRLPVERGCGQPQRSLERLLSTIRLRLTIEQLLPVENHVSMVANGDILVELWKTAVFTRATTQSPAKMSASKTATTGVSSEPIEELGIHALGATSTAASGIFPANPHAHASVSMAPSYFSSAGWLEAGRMQPINAVCTGFRAWGG
jgi:hypothetical protein